MHKSAWDFLEHLRSTVPEIFATGRVLEAGSMNMNGSPRPLFDVMEYVGLDWRPGPGVDAVSLIHEYNDKPNGYFDTVISAETLEHDPFWKKSIAKLVALTRTGGSIILTMAAEGRPPHEIEVSPVKDHYQNMRIEMILGAVSSVRASFEKIVAVENSNPRDLYFLFYKKIKGDSNV